MAIFGAAYYPEQWTPNDWDEDLKIMKDMGLTSVRLGEFAWSILEPQEGKFDFSLFDAILEKVDKAGMTAILGTPTATFPPWLFEKYPDIVQTTKTGIKRIIGSRRQVCFSSKEYRKATERIVTALAKHYGRNKVVSAWQIDNEPGHEGSDLDYSDLSLISFRQWLKKKYSTIKTLNETWGNVFWGTQFDSWDQIPIPYATLASGYNPALIQDFFRFQSDELIGYIEFQASILRKYTRNQTLTVNLFPSPFLAVTDFEKMFRFLDFVSWDNYPVWGNQPTPLPPSFVSSTLAYSHGLKQKPFTVMEQFTGVQGHDTLGYLPAPGQVGLWLVQAIAQGANQIYFFRYRTARFGQEQLCYGILDHGKHLTKKYFELKETIEKVKLFANDVAEIPVSAEALLLHDIDNSRNYKHQPLSDGLKFNPVPFAQVGYDLELAKWFSATQIWNVNTHFVSVNSKIPLNNYKVITLPLYTMYDKSFVEDLDEYVMQGGTLVLGYRAGIKSKDHWMDTEPVPGQFRKMAGIEVHQFESLDSSQNVGVRMGIIPMSSSKFCEIIEPKTAKPFLNYFDSKKHYSGKVAGTVHNWGKGKVYYLGTSLSPIGLLLVYRKILKSAKVKIQFLGKDVERIYREGKEFNYTITMNHSNYSRWVDWQRIKPFGFHIKRFPK